MFVIVRCEDQGDRELLAAKGHVISRDGQRAMLYLPRHLLGLEAATRWLDAAIHGRSSGAQRQPRLDLIARATRRLSAGMLLGMGGHHHTIDGTAAELQPAVRWHGPSGAVLPGYNRRLVRDVEAGAVITIDDIEIDPASTLLALRRQQDACFFGRNNMETGA